MLTVTVTDKDGLVLGEFRFDDSNVVTDEDGVAVVYRDVMRHCSRDGLWYRVAHAASWAAETDSLGRALDPGATCSRLPAPEQQPAEADEERRADLPEDFVVDDDLYRLDRDSAETDEHYRERALMLRCDEQGFIRLPRWRS